MSVKKHPFQRWMEDRAIRDVRFFPANISSSSATQMLDEALQAVTGYEKGKTVPYEDKVGLHDRAESTAV